MPITLQVASPHHPDAQAMIRDLDDYLSALYPAESNHLLDLDELAKPGVVFFLASSGGSAVGCGAVRIGGDGSAEIKRMYVRPEHRGRGIARQLLQALEDQAAARGCRVARLETGIRQPEAIRLYERAGYAERGPFGDYPDDPLSLFYEKPLDAKRTSAGE